MSFLQCESRIPIPNLDGITGRCRKCKPCLRHRQYEWKNRMLLECWGRNYRPLFLTWTFKPSEYIDSRRYVIHETQKLYKRLRRWGHDLRYFTSIERGSKRGRLHAHSIIWSSSLSKLPWHDNFWTLYNAWNKGGIKLRYVQSPGAFHYTSKYIIKDLIPDTDILTGEYTKHRNYTFSNNPRMGYPGINRWRQLVEKFHVEHPPNWFNMPFLGKLEKAYVPSDVWLSWVKENGLTQSIERYYAESNARVTQIERDIEKQAIFVPNYIDIDQDVQVIE